jgi:hypothetical protein
MPELLPLLLMLLYSSASCCRFLFKQNQMRALTMAIRATRPIVSPTAPPVPNPLLPLLGVNEFWAFTGDVGTTVTVWTWPTVVKVERIGEGVEDTEVEDSLEAYRELVRSSKNYVLNSIRSIIEQIKGPYR